MNQPSTRRIESADDVVAPLRDLEMLGWQELLAAQRQGRDPNELVSAFWDRYDGAFAEAERRADAAAAAGVASVSQLGHHLIRAAGDVCHRVPERVTRWGVSIPRVLNTASRRPAPSRPARAGRAVVKRRTRGPRTSTPARGDPDDDPDPHDFHGLTGRSAELARELQAHSDARIAAWRSERIARGTHEQLELERSA